MPILCCAGRGRKAAVEDAEWDWQRSRQLVLLAVHDVMRVDLRALFRGLSAAERMVNLCMELVGGCSHHAECVGRQPSTTLLDHALFCTPDCLHSTAGWHSSGEHMSKHGSPLPKQTGTAALGDTRKLSGTSSTLAIHIHSMHASLLVMQDTDPKPVCLQALQALEAPTVAKQEGCWPACCDVLIRGAVQHEQLDFVAAALMDRARKHEHVPLLAAQAAKVAEDKYNSTQLVSSVQSLPTPPSRGVPLR